MELEVDLASAQHNGCLLYSGGCVYVRRMEGICLSRNQCEDSDIGLAWLGLLGA